MKKLSMAEYLALPAIGAHDIISFLECPAKWKYHKDHPRQTESMAFGSLTHAATLEPETMADNYYVMPKIDRRTKDGKDAYAKAESEAKGKCIVSPEDYNESLVLASSVHACPAAERLMKDAQYEMSATATIEGVAIRSRFDIISKDRYLADLKTTQDASPFGFSREIARYHYHIQAALYLDVFSLVTGEPQRSFAFIAVEKTPPYLCAVYELSEDAIDKGRELYENALRQFRACEFANVWPGYSDHIVTLDLPVWALHEEGKEHAIF